LSDTWRYNGIFNYPTVLDVVISHQQPSIFARMLGFSTVTTAASARATIPGPQFNTAAYAVAAVNGDAMINGGGAAFQTVGGPVYAYGSFGANNGPHDTGVPSVQTNYDGTTCPGSPQNFLDNGGGSNSLNYHTTDNLAMPQIPNIAPPNNYDVASFAALPNVVYASAAAAQDASGHWKPGIYSGFAPSGGFMNGGVYKIINTPNVALGNVTNTIHTLSGTSDPSGAVAIILDGTDGGLDISQAALNGLDDLNAPGYIGPRDPMGTHNFVIWGGGANPYTAGITIGPHAATDMSGIVYLPKSPYVSDGNSSPSFTGSVFVQSMTRARWRQWPAGLQMGVRPERGRGAALRRRPDPLTIGKSSPFMGGGLFLPIHGEVLAKPTEGQGRRGYPGGSSIVKVLPAPGSVLTRIVPPCRSMTRRAMASPRPLPESLR